MIAGVVVKKSRIVEYRGRSILRCGAVKQKWEGEGN